MKWIGTAVLAATVIVVGSPRIEPAAAAPSQSAVGTTLALDASTKPTDISARHHAGRYHHSGRRHYRHVYRSYYPRYYGRPYYYEPSDAPALLPFGFGFGPWW